MRPISAFLAFVLAASLSFAGDGKIRKAADPIPNSYLVILNNETRAEAAKDHASHLARSVNGRAGAVLTTTIKAFAFYGSEQAAVALAHNPLVAWVEEDGYVDLASCPAPPGFDWHQCDYTDDSHWALDRIDQRSKIGTNDGIATYRAFRYTYTGNGVRAYVVDTGIRGSHTEFGGRVTPGANYAYDPEIADAPLDPNEEPAIPQDPAPADNPCYGNIESTNRNALHGTGVASVIGGSSTGVAKGVTLVPVKVASCHLNANNQQVTTISMLATARGLEWVLNDYLNIRNSVNPDQRAVVNISLRFRKSADGAKTCEGAGGGYVNCLNAIEHQVGVLLDYDIPVVVSAGNDSYPVSNDGVAQMGYGGSYGGGQFGNRHTITVGGTEYNAQTMADEPWVCNDGDYDPFSCVNNTGSNNGAAVSIWAPAWNVRSALGFTNSDYRPSTTNHGTSFAAPLVTGAVARILEKYPTKTVDQVWEYLESSGTGTSYGIMDLDSTVSDPKKLLFISPLD